MLLPGEELNMLPGTMDDPYVSLCFVPGHTVNHLWPEVEYPDIYNFLLVSTLENSLKHTKSLDGYNFFIQR